MILKIQIYILLLLVSLDATSQTRDNSSYIYGTIITESDEEYTGFIRWGNEEMYWHDIFNSVKVESYKAPENITTRTLEKIDWSLKSLWSDNYCESCNTNKSFACLFGDLAQIEIIRGKRARLTFRNGSTIDVDGGSNDIGSRIQMTDYELGAINFDWDDIEFIKFKIAPDQASPPYGDPLYGTIITERKKKFKGYIKWDLDERHGQDLLNGESKYGDQSIPFENISLMEKIRNGNGLRVTFQSGREIEIEGSNDCNKGNRGIAIFRHDIGNIEMAWSDFKSVTFDKAPAKVYGPFEEPQRIAATMLTYDDVAWEGPIAFDKDEVWDFEFVDGDDDDIEYQIPFRNISKIVPKNRSFSMVHLKNGDVLLLGEKQDVSSDNDGVILNATSDQQEIINWDNIIEIIFK